MTVAGSQALNAERHILRINRAVAFLRRNFASRVAHLGDAELQNYAVKHLDSLARSELTSAQDQLSAFAPAIYWGPTWWNEHMPVSMLVHCGHWDAPLAPQAQLSRCLAALDIWHAALVSDLSDRNRAANILHELYIDPRAAAHRGRDVHNWCAQFAPQIWSLMDDNSRHGHIAAAAKIASRCLYSFQDEIMFACVGLVLGVNFVDNPLYPQFRTALEGHEHRPTDDVRISLGTALVSYWQQIDGGLQK